MYHLSIAGRRKIAGVWVFLLLGGVVCNISFIHCGKKKKGPGKDTAAAGAAPPTPIRVQYFPVSKLAACFFSPQGLAKVHYYYDDY